MPELIRVLVADDHGILRAGIRQFIDSEPDMRVSGEASTGDEALELVRSKTFDVVLLDISMPRKNGIDCLRAIRQFNNTLPVLIVSNFPEKLYAINMLSMGANGYFQKSDNPAELIKAIRKVAVGHSYLSSNTAEILADELVRPSPKKPHELLSEREYQIFHRLAAGGAVTQISLDLNLSTKTISTYRARVLSKLQLKTNADLTRYAIKNGLIN